MSNKNDIFTNPAFAKATPANFALYCSNGRWKMAKHLALLNRELVEIATGRNKRLLVSMPPRPQPRDSKVLMANGQYKALSLVKIGDEVISHKGVPRKVLDVIDAGMQPIVTIRSARGIRIKLAESHRIGIEDRGWVEAKDIVVKDRIVCLYNIPIQNPVHLEKDVAYNLGLFTALSSKRKDGVHSLRNFTRDKIPKGYKAYVDDRDLLSTKGQKILESFGWTESKVIPEIAWNLDEESALHYILGFLTPQNRPNSQILRYALINRPEYIDNISLLFFRYGILNAVSHTDNSDKLNIHNRQTIRYLREAFDGNVAKLTLDAPRYSAYKVNSVIFSEPEPCICLTVEGDCSYISEGYVSHNSGKCISEGEEVFKCDGSPIKIEHVKEGDKVLSVGPSSCLYEDTVTHTTSSGKKECHKVTLFDGHELIATKDHKFLSTNGFQALKDLKPNMYLATCPYPTPNHNIRWSRLKSIKKVGLRPTFDLQIEKYNNFVANGIVVHNSELVSKYFPAWYLGAFPDNQLIFSTYEAHFAAEFGGAARDLLTEYGPEVFGVNVKEGSAAASRWKIEQRLGIMQCAGVGGPLTGKGADVLIVDDPIKNDQEAESLLMRNKIFNWFGATASTRLMPGGSIVIVMTRWHCLLPGNKVLSSLGYINIEDVKENDEVLSTEGYCKVKAIANKYTSDTCYSFKLFANPDELHVTSDHKILTNNGWKKAEEINIKDKLFCPKPTKKYANLDFLKLKAPGKEKPFDYKALEDEDFWFCVGLWVAEGCITYGRKTGNHNSVRYTLNSLEENIIIYVKNTLKKYGVDLNYKVSKNTIQAKCTNYHLARLLENFGRGALNKRIPEFVFSLDEPKLVSLLKGIYVGDGCSHEKYLRIASSSLSLLQGIRLCLLQLNCPSSIMYVRKEKKSKKVCGKECNINKSWELRTVCDKLLPVKDPMIFESISVTDKGCYFNIKNISSYLYEGPVYDIQTESGDFLVEGCIVHNCDDLIGRLLDKMNNEGGEKYKYLKFSAICNETEETWPKGLGRKPGEALWPEMWPIESMEKIKNSGALSSYYWSALYQQEPAPEGGGIFKEKWFRYFITQGDYYLLEDGQGNSKYIDSKKCWNLITVDTANKVKDTSDYTAIGTWAITPDNDILLIDLVRDRIGYDEILKKLIHKNVYFKPRYIGIENMGIAIQLIIEARNKQLPVRELEPGGKGKQNRANMPLGAVIRMENGKVYFPKEAPYRSDIELELLTFPKAKHDEIVDILSYACNELTKFDVYDNDDFLPYSLDQALPLGMRKPGGFGF